MSLANLYDQVAQRYDSIFTKAADAIEDAITGEWLRPVAGSVLDIGCGTGLLLDAHPAPYHIQYVGLDISRQMLVSASTKHRFHPFYECDATKPLPIRPASQDWVCSLWLSPSHIFDWEILASEIDRVLRPGGQILFFFLSHKGLKYRRWMSYLGDMPPEMVYRPWSVEGLHWLFSGYRLTVQGMTGFPLWMRSLPPPVLWRLYRLEQRTWGRWWPDACRLLIVKGQKPNA